MSHIATTISVWALGFALGFGLGGSVAALSRLKHVWGNEFKEVE